MLTGCLPRNKMDTCAFAGEHCPYPRRFPRSATARTLSAADVFATPAWPQQSNTDQQMSFRNR